MICYSCCLPTVWKWSSLVSLPCRKGSVRGGVEGSMAGRERRRQNLLLQRREVLVQRDWDLQHGAAQAREHPRYVSFEEKKKGLVGLGSCYHLKCVYICKKCFWAIAQPLFLLLFLLYELYLRNNLKLIVIRRCLRVWKTVKRPSPQLFD